MTNTVREPDDLGRPAHPQRRSDVVVVGGGVVGVATALALARGGVETLLLAPAGPGRDGRTVAVMEGSLGFLEGLGEDIAAGIVAASAPLERLRIVDDTGSLFRPPPATFAAGEIGLPAFGRNIEAADLVELLLRAARTQAGLTIVARPARTVRLEPDAVFVTDADGGVHEAALAVGADGRRSMVREAARITARDWSYPQTALTTILAHTRPHAETSTEFHTRAGPFTLVPLPGRRSSLVWLTRPDHAEALHAMPDETLAAAVERQAHSMLGRMTLDGPRGLTPMRGLSVERLTGPRAALVGEAAHVMPPIGAQGLNLGLRDAAALAGVVLAAHDSGGDVGGPASLKAYEQARRFDVRSRTAAVDALGRSLLADILPVDLARGAGLLAMATIGPLRRFVMRQGMTPQGMPERSSPGSR